MLACFPFVRVTIHADFNQNSSSLSYSGQFIRRVFFRSQGETSHARLDGYAHQDPCWAVTALAKSAQFVFKKYFLDS